MSVRRHLIRNNTAVTSVKSGSFGGVNCEESFDSLAIRTCV